MAFTHSWVVRMATHPLMALGMYIASLFVMYFTGLYDAAVPSHWAHLVMNTHSLLRVTRITGSLSASIRHPTGCHT